MVLQPISPARRLRRGQARPLTAAEELPIRPKDVVVVCRGYPSRSQPEQSPRLHELVVALARRGHRCRVISPTHWLERRQGALPGREETEATEGCLIRVMRPRYLPTPAGPGGPNHTARLAHQRFGAAAWRAIRTLVPAPEVIYGHDFYPGGLAAVQASARLGCAGVMEVGASSDWAVNEMGLDRARQDFAAAMGAIAASSGIGRELVEGLGLAPGRVLVLPEGIDLGVFYRRERSEMCRKQCLRPDWFNIAFVGDDGPEPGVARLLAAVRGLPKVALIGVGRGRWPELAGEVVERQALPHRLVAEVLGAADLFVQLTTGASPGEGLMAAMACGLPVIASDGPGLDDVLSKEVAIRVDPRDAGALRGAIQTVVANPILRVAMAAASLKHARRFDIVHRARAMMEWIGCRLPARPGKPD